MRATYLKSFFDTNLAQEFCVPSFIVCHRTFPQSGKFKVSIDGEGLKESTKAALEGKKRKGKDKAAAPTNDAVAKEQPITLHLEFKRYIFSKKMAQ